MPRKNNRLQSVDDESDAFDSAEAAYVIKRTRLETEAERDARIRAEGERRRFRNERRADTRIAQLVDWSKCCIPGCDAGSSGSLAWHPKDVTEVIPVCYRHEVIITRQTESRWTEPDYLATRQRLSRQRVVREIEAERKADLQHESAGAKQGQIYFVRLNGLIKVGWASKLRSRLKSYGASAEILCHFPASRADETHLHRQLRPYLAKGREWYQDCKLIEDVTADYIKQYGQPTIFPDWTVPKPDVICTKRSA